MSGVAQLTLKKDYAVYTSIKLNMIMIQYVRREGQAGMFRALETETWRVPNCHRGKGLKW